MQLKLAEYKDGKFERFLELGKGFGYFGDSILLMQFCEAPVFNIIGFFNLANWFKDDERFDIIQQGINNSIVKKDEKDPLNRFSGLFDGMTYGEGRYVLIRGIDGNRGWENDIIKRNSKLELVEFEAQDKYDAATLYDLNEFIGNLYQNSELWDNLMAQARELVEEAEERRLKKEQFFKRNNPCN